MGAIIGGVVGAVVFCVVVMAAVLLYLKIKKKGFGDVTSGGQKL